MKSTLTTIRLKLKRNLTQNGEREVSEKLKNVVDLGVRQMAAEIASLGLDTIVDVTIEE